MLLFMIIGICSAIGIRIGIVRSNKRILRISLIILLINVIFFIIGSIMYAIYE
ncbi:hypothetical protein CcarbDRAFT_5029 [Clostridium carboxidivorans P7]|uniref:Uncharacterized protein n=1 Tax=Clostridium carboxidivorans P7 TaxID=536227 RepID=C6Q1W1_9CLOT|nr:hypothetical protein CcarbDRAFT_5029 [Clostridium carboxidivorans P7]